MAVTPSGPLSVPPDSLRTTLSTLPSVWAFLTSTGTPVTDATSALTKIYSIARPATATSGESAWSRPYILISDPKELTTHRGGYATGTLFLMFERDVPSSYSTSYVDAHYDFTNLVGAVLQAASIACEGDGTLFMQYPIRTAVSPTRSEPDSETTDYMQAAYWIDYGPRMEN